MEQLQIIADDADAYDTKAEGEVDWLEQSLLEERDSQGKRKKAHRQVTEKRENRTVASQKERMDKFMQLVGQLTTSEQTNWKDQWRARDQLQMNHTTEWMRH